MSRVKRPRLGKKSIPDLPPEMISNIIDSIRRPNDHLAFAHSCAEAFGAYTAQTFKRLCHFYGFGRAGHNGDRLYWQRQFERVVRHANTCQEFGCVHFGVLPPGQTEQLISDEYALWDWAEGDKSPMLHRHLSLLGSINVGDYIHGFFSTVPDLQDIPGRTTFRRENDFVSASMLQATDWTQDDGIWREKPVAPVVRDHPVLESAFCCNPPVKSVKLKFFFLSELADVTNEDGVTVGDVLRGTKLWYMDRPTKVDLIEVRDRLKEFMGMTDLDAFYKRNFETREQLCLYLYEKEYSVAALRSLSTEIIVLKEDVMTESESGEKSDATDPSSIDNPIIVTSTTLPLSTILDSPLDGYTPASSLQVGGERLPVISVTSSKLAPDMEKVPNTSATTTSSNRGRADICLMMLLDWHDPA